VKKLFFQSGVLITRTFITEKCKSRDTEVLRVILLPSRSFAKNHIENKQKTRMIKAILIFNNHGKPRLIRFYQYFVRD